MTGDLRILSGWTLQAIGDIGEIVTGKTPSTKVPGHFDGDIPFITPSDMDGRRIISNTARYVTNKGAATVSSSRIPKGAVMVSCIGSDMGKAAIAGSDAITNQQINSIVVHEGICSLYVYYDLSARQREIQYAGAGGSAVPILNKGHFCQLPIMLPPIKQQQAIACILGALDDKIELNRKMNQTLEEMARAIFKSWFVDFDPVRAKAAGHQPPGLKPDIAALFPNRFEDSELGEIPKGWSVTSLADQITAAKGLSYKGQHLCAEGEGLPMHNLNSVYEGGSYKHEGLKWYNGEYRPAHLLMPGDVIVTNTEQGFDYLLIGYSAIVPECYGPKGLFSHHIFRIRPKSTSYLPAWFTYLLLRTQRFHDLVAGHSNGTTVNMLPLDGLQKPKLVLPPEALVERFEALFCPAHQRIEQIHDENASLAALRDTLLPKLISGELAVAEAERIAGRCA